MNSTAVYVGSLSHLRRVPVRHAFRYRLYMLYLDLDELPRLRPSPLFGVERARPLSFRRRDYLGRPERPLKAEVLDEVERTLGQRPRGPVRLLTQVRSLGYVFNPVSFYYCFDEAGHAVQAVVAEITNTPWGERHRYVLAAGAGGARASFAKAFHVSPFFPMNQTYHWRLSLPGPWLRVAMANEEGGRIVFQARLALVRRPLFRPALARIVLGLPLMSWRVHAGIYAQALRLGLRGLPFFPHPATGVADRAEEVR